MVKIDKATNPLSDNPLPRRLLRGLPRRRSAHGNQRVVYFFPCGSPVTSTCSFVPTSFSAYFLLMYIGLLFSGPWQSPFLD